MPESKKEENISNMPATQIYLHTKPRSHTPDAQIVLEILNKSVKKIGKSHSANIRVTWMRIRFSID